MAIRLTVTLRDYLIIFVTLGLAFLLPMKEALAEYPVGLIEADSSSNSAAPLPIPGLFPTGIDISGKVLAHGASDPHYRILSPNQSAVVVTPNIDWLPDSTTSRWVWQTASGQPIYVTRAFRITFDLTGLDSATTVISGTWATDDYGRDILINGVSTANICGQVSGTGYRAYCNFSIASGFVSGVNTLDFVVEDTGGNIAGLRVDSIHGTLSRYVLQKVLRILFQQTFLMVR
jgi:hypothetical protein